MILTNGKEKEKACEIEIEESLVVIICGDIELEKLKGCLKALSEQKFLEDD